MDRQSGSVPRLLSFDLGFEEAGDGSLVQPQRGADAPHGYDTLVRIVRAHGLPSADWWNGLSDPYTVVRLSAPGDSSQTVQYKTQTVFRDLNPVFDEFFEAANVPAGSTLHLELWDKDLLTRDDVLGRTSWRFEPLPSGAASVRLPLQHPRRAGENAGHIELELHYRPSEQAGPLCMLGPVRFRQQLSPVSGLLMGRWTEDVLAYSTYKLFLCHISDVFDDVSYPWNRDHAAAATIFRNPVALAGVRTQHATLYATHLGRSRAGVLRSPGEFFALFGFGLRGGERRYFTYSLLPDSLRCSETGAQFWTDMFSKHAMHANAAEKVLFAGEFCIVPEQGAPGKHKLVIDNNSGTYAPKAQHLPLMAQLFTANFPTMRVETIAVGDPRLEEYHIQCPSRLKAAAAAAAAAEVEQEAAGRQGAGCRGGDR